MIDWVIYITVGIVVGFAAGFFYTRLDDSMKRKCEELENKLDDAKQEMKSYKQDVTQHFIQTSSLINNMTDSYRAVYDHMADGAKTLCSNGMIEQARMKGELDIPTARLVETFENEEATNEPNIASDAASDEENAPVLETTQQTAEENLAEEETTAHASAMPGLDLTPEETTAMHEAAAQAETEVTDAGQTATEPDNEDAEEHKIESKILPEQTAKGPDKDTPVVH